MPPTKTTMRGPETISSWTCFNDPPEREKWQAMFMRSFLPVENILADLKVSQGARKYELSPWWSMGTRSVAFLFTTSQPGHDQVIKVCKPWVTEQRTMIPYDDKDAEAYQTLATSTATATQLAKILFQEYHTWAKKKYGDVRMTEDPYEFLCQMANSAIGDASTPVVFIGSHRHRFQHQTIREGHLTRITEPETVNFKAKPIPCGLRCKGAPHAGHSNVCNAISNLHKQYLDEFLNSKFLSLESVPIVPIEVCGLLQCGTNTPWMPYMILSVIQGTSVEILFEPWRFTNVAELTQSQLNRAISATWKCLAVTQLKLSRHTGKIVAAFRPNFAAQGTSNTAEEMVAKYKIITKSGDPNVWQDPRKRLRHIAARALFNAQKQDEHLFRAWQVIALFLCALDEPDVKLELLLHTTDMGGMNAVYDEKQNVCRSFDHEHLWFNPTPFALCPPSSFGLALADFLEDRDAEASFKAMWQNREDYAGMMRKIGRELGLEELGKKFARDFNSDLTVLFEALKLVQAQEWTMVKRFIGTDFADALLKRYSLKIEEMDMKGITGEFVAWQKRYDRWQQEHN